MRKALVITILAALPVLGIAGYAVAGDQSELADLRAATAKYHDIQVARALHDEVELAQVAPFGSGTCIENLTGDGAMGIHLLLQDRLADGLVPTEPEVLLYEKRNDGSYKLAGVEYVVGGGARPVLFGQPFDETNLARYGDPGATVWTLHAWIWTPNHDAERGLFAPWNTRITCD